MPASPLEQLAAIMLDAPAAAELGLAPGPLVLKRAWPMATGHLTAELADPAGRVLAAQWFSDSAQLQDAYAPAGKHGGRTALLGATLLQVHGADALLHSLAALVSTPGAELLVHRAQRRAVVRVARGPDRHYIKLVKPKKIPDLLARYDTARGHLGSIVPTLLRVDRQAGAMTWSELPGRSVHELLSSPQALTACEQAGTLLAQLHRGPPQAPPHTAAGEAAILREAHQRLACFFPVLAAEIAEHIQRAAAALEQSSPAPPVLIHRDFYDKQVFIASGGRLGLLDLDLLSAGEPEVDLGNWLAHLRLRALQGLCPADKAALAEKAFLAAYGATAAVDAHRLALYTRSTLLRLACIYPFRPQNGDIARPLLDAAARLA